MLEGGGKVGDLVISMLKGQQHRGSDSAGVALFHGMIAYPDFEVPS